MKPQRLMSGVMLFLCCAGSVPGSEPVVVRTAVATEGRIRVGQQVKLHVDVLGRDGWAQIKKVGEFDVPGALVLRVETQGTRLQEQIGGESYTGQRYEVLVFPRRAGVIEFPEVSLDIKIQQWGASAGSSEKQMSAPAVSFTSEMPPGCEGISDLISTRRLSMRQEWVPADVDTMKEGDSLKRIVTLEASGIPGAAIAPFAILLPDGVEVYPDQPQVQNSIQPAGLDGSRSEAVTYIFNQTGSVKFDEVKLSWWDLDAGELKHEVLPGRTVEVMINPLVQQNNQAVRESSSMWRYVFLALVAGGVSIIWVKRAKVEAWCSQRREQKSFGEAAFFKRFVKSAQGDDPSACLNALMAWLDKIYPGKDTPGLRWFLTEYVETKDQKPALKLLSCVSSPSATDWDGRAVMRCIRQGRKKRSSEARRNKRIQSVLPDLKPSTGNRPG